MQRAGNRRYYRPADVELVRRINRLLNHEGYTVRGVQKLLREQGDCAATLASDFAAAVSTAQQATADIPQHEEPLGVDVFRLIALRNRLSDALDS